MRRSLPHLIEDRRARRATGRRTGTAARTHRHPEGPGPAGCPPPAPDPETARAREAGGPLDEAHYSCQCGYLFAASVSTTVACPHCGQGQAW